MSEHGHDEHGGHGDAHPGSDAGHGAVHDDHGGHDDHGHGGGEGDYNTLPPGPSTLPHVPAWGLAFMGGVLALLLSIIVYSSLVVTAEAESHDAHGASHGEASEAHGTHADKKAEH